MKLFIPVICYNHTAHTSFMFSLMSLILSLKHHNIPTVLYPITFESLISRARNAAIAHFMSDPETTHILFIDSDIEFKVEDVFALLQVQGSVEARAHLGGTAPKQVLAAIKQARADLAS